MPGPERSPEASRQPAPAPRPVRDDLFSPVTSRRISEVIVEQVRELIRQGQLVAGSRLPSERDLCEKFGASRVTVREALRVLEATGLVEIRIGARGGAFVTAPSAVRVGEGITDLLTMSGLSAQEVTEARRIFELGIIPLICERADEDDLTALDALCDEAEQAVERGGYTMTMSSTFHRRLAEAAHNGAVSLLAESFHGPVLASLEKARAVSPYQGEVGVREHRELLAAIRRKDVTAALDVMTKHLDRTVARVAGH